MSDTTQNDWDVVEQALGHVGSMLGGSLSEGDAALAALARLREFTKITISGLNERISELEAELEKTQDERNELVVSPKEWPRPANLPRTW